LLICHGFTRFFSHPPVFNDFLGHQAAAKLAFASIPRADDFGNFL